MSDVYEQLEDLSPAQRKLVLEKLRQLSRPSKADARRLPTRPARRGTGAAHTPLSFAQQRLWLLDQIEGSGHYVEISGCLIDGALDVQAFEQSLTAVVARHEILRTTFPAVDGVPFQRVGPPVDVVLRVEDVADEAEVHRIAGEESLAPFDLEAGPLFRIRLLRLSAHRHAILLAMHHIVCDKWSAAIFLSEVAACYEAARQGTVADLPELPFQYADYAVWQREALTPEAAAAHLDFWRRCLDAAPAALDLPTDHPRVGDVSFAGAAETFSIDAELSAALTAVGRRAGATLFMTLQAAFAVLLSRYSGQQDLVIGVPVANRDDTSLESLIGFFVNTVAQRIDVTGAPSFLSLVQRVRVSALEAAAHHELPFERIVEELQPPRAPGRHPFFQAMFAFQSVPVHEPRISGLTLTPIALAPNTAKFDLTLNVSADGAGLQGALEYRTALFDAATIRRMAAHFMTLLRSAVADPLTPVTRLALLDPAERRRQLTEWNETPASGVLCGEKAVRQGYVMAFSEPQDGAGRGSVVATETEAPGSTGVREEKAVRQGYVMAFSEPQDGAAAALAHTIFEAHARRAPDAPAIAFEDSRLTYAELDARANRLAHYLRTLGVERESLVALLLDRSPDAIVAMLAVLKAGAAFVPIDPAYPPARIAYMLEDSRARLALTVTPFPSALAGSTARVICLDRELQAIDACDAVAPAVALDAENVAYVIYTSGSTGRPKGVLIQHSSLRNLAAAQIPVFHVSASSRVLQFAPLSFDVSISEIFMALCSGAELHLARRDSLMPGGDLAAVLRDGRITHLTLPPSALAVMSRDDAPGLETLAVAGEACPPALASLWCAVSSRGGRRFINAYGPTESTVYSTWGECRTDETERAPIGRPVANGRAYVLDAEGQPVPVGVVGELFVGGILLARGYLDRPDLTAAAFLPDPFAARPGARMYRTGDLARYLADGRIDFVGRVDRQFKIRGFRIEAGEVETALAAHPAVAESLAVARGDRLIAYVVPRQAASAKGSGAPGGVHLDTAELRAFVSARLPAFMVPSAFVELERVPLTPAGKIDHAALPLPGADLERRDEHAPRTLLQETLAATFGSLLEQADMGVHDDFFELGGHSLLAARLVTRVREACGVDLTLRHFFESPTIAGVERAILALGSAGRAARPALAPVPRDPSGTLSLSFAQQRLWFLDQLASDDTYNISGALDMRGSLDESALERSLHAVVQRHEILRTTFPAVGGVPVQRIEAEDRIRLRRESAPTRAALEQLAEADARAPFDLAHGPLVRVTLVSVGSEEHVLLIAMHHIVADGWSLGILVDELMAGYAAFVRSKARGEALPFQAPFAPLAVQYADYASWQRSWLTEEALEEQLGYWRVQLRDAPELLDLPTDSPRPPVRSSRGRVSTLRLDRDLVKGIQGLSRASGATVYMTLLAAFAAVLGRHARQDDVVLGAGIAGRNAIDVEPLIGFFVNTLALRVNCSGTQTFDQLLRRVRRTALDAYMHQDVPFERLVEELRPERSLSYTPIFQVMFVQQTGLTPQSLHGPPKGGHYVVEGPGPPEGGHYVVEGLRVAPLELENVAAKWDLTVFVEESGPDVTASIVYSTDLFEAATIERLARHYESLLRGVVADPSRAVADVPLMQAGERQQLLREWNPRGTPFAEELTLHGWFDAQVSRTPTAVALTCEGSQLTYRELAERANQLAHYLQGLGVRAEVRVALLFDRSVDMVVSILGVLKAGGAYVPIDPMYPRDRRAFMLEDSGAAILLTQEKLVDECSGMPARIIAVDSSAADIARHSSAPVIAAADPASAATSASLAYVIYTSGSTGQPKGSLITHRNVVRLFEAARPRFGFGESDVWTLFHSYGFDFSVWEIWGALLHGGRLVVVPYLVSRSASEFHELLVRARVTVLNQTPSAFYPLIEADAAANAGALSLRLVIFGGEALEMQKLRPWFERHGDRAPQLVNGYGITETTVFTTFQAITKGQLEGTSLIGTPIPDWPVYVVDDLSELVPIGVPGELLVGGEGLARGYLGRPELTAERFIPDPFGEQPGARLYRSGDLARFRPDGTLQYLGRIDQQVKIRGFRIEPGEIEAVIAAHAGIRECAVVPYVGRVPRSVHRSLGEGESGPAENASGPAGHDMRLAAYVAADAADWPSLVRSMRLALEQRVPAYMIPSSFMRVDALPLTVNGKLDRRALPTPQEGGATGGVGGSAGAAPSTETERRLAAVFAGVLGIEQRLGSERGVCVDDNFFELGGHSLLATQVVSRVRDAFGIELPLVELFKSPTVAGLASEVEAQVKARGAAGFAQSQPAIARITRGTAPLQTLPISFAQERLWFLNQLEPENPFYNVALALTLSGPLDADALRTALRRIIQRHETLRMRFETVEGQPAARVDDAVTLDLRTIDCSHLPEPERSTELQRLAVEEARRPFQLDTDPLIRATLVRLKQDRRALDGQALPEHALLLTMHHIVSDGWSLGVLVREVGTFYLEETGRHFEPLPELPIQYADFAAWQRTWLRGNVLETQLAYWKDRFRDVPAALALPADRTRPARQSFRGGQVTFTVPPTVTARLQQVSHEAGATLFMTLCSAFAALLSRYSGQDDLVIGTPIANRTRAEVEPLVGFFVNTLALRTDLSGRPTFRELLGRMRHAALDAYAHQDLPFERLVDELKLERDLSLNPLFQVMFALQNAPLPPLELPGLRIAPLQVNNTPALFDLVLDMWELGEGVAGLTGLLQFSADLFDEATARRLVSGFERLLEAVVADPSVAVADLPVLAEADERKLLEEWAGPRAAYQVDRTLDGLFEEVAARSADAVAIVHRGRLVTYRELNDAASRLAGVLQRSGVERGEFVGILHERGIEFITAMLAVMKAGGAFLPIDTDYPPDRIAYMLADSGVRTLVSQSALASPSFPRNTEPPSHRDKTNQVLGASAPRWSMEATGAAGARLESAIAASSVRHVVALDAIDLGAEAPLGQPATLSPTMSATTSATTGADCAYMLYTSGSTGRPKGAIVRHNGAINHIYGEFDLLRFHPGTAFLQSAPCSSDISVWQCLGPLLAGGRVVVADFEDVCDAPRLFDLIATERVTLIELVPEVMKELLEYARTERSAEADRPASTGSSGHAATRPSEGADRPANTGSPKLASPQLAGVVRESGPLSQHRVVGSQSDPTERRRSERRRATRPLPHLECAMVTGEAVPPPLVNDWLATYPDIPLVNAYGPTEAADDICQAVIGAPLGRDQRSVPIGQPLPNLRIYVLDQNLRLVPHGVLGEICVSGIGVGEGYWRDPERTRAAFVPNPYASSDEWDRVIYRTGDLGRWLPGGILECLNRTDDQVKLRGFRIEPGEIAAAVDRHPWVRSSAIVIHGEGEERRLVAYVTPDLADEGAAVKLAALREEQIGLWESLHEQSYVVAAGDDPTFNTIGWDSTYTDSPLPDAQMREYVTRTVERIVSTGARDVLEIGCGTGLIMFALLPHCRRYFGSDLSAVAIEQLRELQRRPDLRNRIPGLADATLSRRRADDLQDVEPGRFDCAILPSVVQYFPGIEYLVSVLGSIIERLPDGGSVFLGDVRSRPLLDAYWASVRLHKAPDAMPIASLAAQVQHQVAREQELTIAPAFFAALRRHFPRIASVEVLPKRGRLQNEMTRFRYDVVLRIGAPLDGRSSTLDARESGLDAREPDLDIRRGGPSGPPVALDIRRGGPSGPPSPIAWEEWDAAHPSAAAIADRLRQDRPARLALRRVANARVDGSQRLLRALAEATPGTAGDLRQTLAAAAPHGVEPEDLWAIAEGAGYSADISLAAGHRDGAFDLVLTRLDVLESLGRPDLAMPADPKPWHHYANNPLHEKLAGALTRDLRDTLKDALPNYMVPSEFVVLPSLPLMPNGKIDRRALPPPPEARRSAGYVQPATTGERAVASIWADVLGLERVGALDNFFELGGHSLKATRVVSRIHREMGVVIPLREIFTSPTVRELAAAAAAQQASAYTPIPRTDEADSYPLSHAQRRLWILSQMTDSPAAYNIPATLVLDGTLDVDALRGAFDELVSRHESLRTSFVMVNGEPRQRVEPPPLVRLKPDTTYSLTLPVIDLSGDPAPLERARMLALEDAQRPFDLERAPLLRTSLLRIGPSRHVLVAAMHHIVSDEWSLGVMVRELMAFYSVAVAGSENVALSAEARRAKAEPLRVHYRDYAAWQNAELAEGAAARHRDYWMRQLAGELPIVNLPADLPRPPVKTYNGRVVSIAFDPEESEAIRRVGRERNASLFMVLTAMVNALLHRWTAQDDLIVGCPVGGREHADLEHQIGFYVNMLPLRVRVDGQLPFEALLRQVKDVAAEAYEHQGFPFDLLVDELNVPRDVSRSPLFDVVVILQDVRDTEMSLPGLRVAPFVREYDMSKYDLQFTFEEKDEAISLDLVYNTDLFTDDAARRFGRHFRELATGVAADPLCPVGRSNILPRDERERLLEWGKSIFTGHGDTETRSPDLVSPELRDSVAWSDEQATTLVSWFEAQAARTPDRIAASIAGGAGRAEITYADLDAEANRLAARLRELGAGRGTLVAMRVERSIEMVVGIVAVLKSGAGYVPIEPDVPIDRATFMIRDAGAQILLTTLDAADDVTNAGAVIVCIDDESAVSGALRLSLGTPRPSTNSGRPEGLEGRAASRGGGLPSGPEPAPPEPDDTAYVIYTSGSTGQPKGVVVTHRNVVRLFTSTDAWFGFGQNDVWTLFHSYAFDFSVWELWGALLYGGRLVIVPKHVARAPDAFHRLLREERVTVLNQTPSAFRGLIEADASEDPQALSLRWVIFGGEALDPRSLAPWYARHADDRPRLVNMYGITETTVHVTYRPLSAGDAESGGSMIGVPIPDLQVYVLDPYGQPAPIGVAGELYVGGAGVADGYLNRPELTAERFVASPLPAALPADDGARLYRSGDLARYTASGDLEYLGRADDQVKIRGFRIELGEVEAALAAHPAVSQAVVVVDREQAGDPRLIAYVVADAARDVVAGLGASGGNGVRIGTVIDGPAPDVAELRRHLRERLPEYMVPSAFVSLDAIPLTVNGKLDRRALPKPDDVPDASAPYLAPRDAMEETLAGVFRDVLRVGRIGVNENFFDAGAHSLSIVQAHQKLRLLGIDLPVVSLFQFPTVAALAEHLSASAQPLPSTDAKDRASNQKAARERRAKSRLPPVEPA